MMTADEYNAYRHRVVPLTYDNIDIQPALHVGARAPDQTAGGDPLSRAGGPPRRHRASHLWRPPELVVRGEPRWAPGLPHRVDRAAQPLGVPDPPAALGRRAPAQAPNARAVRRAD